MATLQALDASGEISKLDLELGARQQVERLIYLMPRIIHWLKEDLPALGSSWNIEESPEQQFYNLAEVFITGATLTFDLQFKPLNHLGNGIWELKTADLRIFGWFPGRDCFVATNADTAQRIKEHGLYRGYQAEAAQMRAALQLDEPKFIEGSNPHAVVSAFAYP
jgi:hypothetical protein